MQRVVPLMTRKASKTALQEPNKNRQKMTKKGIIWIGAAILLLVGILPAAAQDYPTKFINLIIQYPLEDPPIWRPEPWSMAPKNISASPLSVKTNPAAGEPSGSPWWLPSRWSVCEAGHCLCQSLFSKLYTAAAAGIIDACVFGGTTTMHDNKFYEVLNTTQLHSLSSDHMPRVFSQQGKI